jgi:hypothetical protein
MEFNKMEFNKTEFNKTEFDILEVFTSNLLKDDITMLGMLKSERNHEAEIDTLIVPMK